MGLEKHFQNDFIDELKCIFPGCIVIKNDPNYRQGTPDLLLLWGDQWAMFEVKRNVKASIRPNQIYWIERYDEMSFARFVYPENKNEVLNEIQIAFGIGREPCLSFTK